MALPSLDRSATTRFGSSSADLGHAASVLRAQAARSGMVLGRATLVDLAAAVIGADAWMLVTSATGMQHAPRYGRAARNVYLAILLRASGCGPVGVPPFRDASTADEVISAADGYARWASRMLGGEARQALQLAALDLAVAELDRQFLAVSGALLIAADTLTDIAGTCVGSSICASR